MSSDEFKHLAKPIKLNDKGEIELSPADYRFVTDLIQNPPEPNEALLRAVRKARRNPLRIVDAGEDQ